MAMFMYNLGSNIGTKMLIFRVIGKKNRPKQLKYFKKREKLHKTQQTLQLIVLGCCAYTQ